MAFSPINHLEFLKLMDVFRPSMRLKAWAVCSELLMRARRVDGTVDGVDLKRGQAIYGEDALAVTVGTTRKTIRNVILSLKKHEKGAIETSKQGSVLTWCNYDTLSGTVEAAATEKGPTGGQQGANEGPLTIRSIGSTEKEEKSTNYLDRMAELWANISGAPEKPPFSMFNKWKSAHGEAACLAGVQKVVLNGKVFDKSPLPYVAKVIAGTAEEIQAEERASVEEPALQFPDNMVGQHITYPNTNNPIKPHQKRMAAILARDSTATTDPDQGHPWTIPDSEFKA